MQAGTLHVEEDRFGLWFEAALQGDAGRHTYLAMRCGAVTGLSWGSSGGFSKLMTGGIREYSAHDAWEISILTTPAQPRFSNTWMAPNAEARRHRRFYR
jgi:phage head maturation protease